MAQFPSNAAKDDEDEQAAAEAAAAAEAQDTASSEDAPEEPHLSHSAEKISDGPDEVSKVAADAPDDTAPAKPSAPFVSDYIAKKYGLGSSAATYNKLAGDNSKVLAAREQANSDKDTSRLFESLGYAFGGGKRQDDGYYKDLRNEADKKVAVAQGDQQQLIKNYLTSRQLGTEDVNQAQKEKLADFTNTQNDRTLQQQAALDEPTSAESDFAREMAKSLDPDHADTYKDKSATQIQRMLPYVKDIFDKQMKQKDFALRMGMANDNRQWQRDFKNTQLNGGFVKGFNAEENKFQAATGKIDETLNMVDQATTGGVASQLVPLEVARAIAGRLNPQEIAAASGDPSIAGKIQRYLDKASDGTMTVKDAQEYKTLLQSQKDTLANVRNKQRDQNISAWAKSTGQDPQHVRAMVLDQQTAPSGAAAPGSPAPKAPGATYTTAQEAGIKKVMDDNKGVTREQAIQALRDAKVLK